ncbi:MAG: hypothetical protein K2W92_09430 [Alphaproteobacteria bacterium]|nr:hypothetical protein [Alphaproteobacteria bacterium]
MKQFIQGTLLLGMLTSIEPLSAGKCEDHGGHYKDLAACLKAEEAQYDNEIDNINEDDEMIPSTRAQARMLAEGRYKAGVQECKDNCNK